MVDVYTEQVVIKGIKYTGTFDGQVCLKLEPFKKIIGQRVEIKDLSPGDTVEVTLTANSTWIEEGSLIISAGYENDVEVKEVRLVKKFDA